jgi:hypothetical protein
VLTLALMLLSAVATAQAPPSPSGGPIVLGTRFSMDSPALGEQRSVQVHLPAGYALSAAHYPVVFVTDGNEHFEHVSATVDFLAAAGEAPPMIVVGIPNTSRYRDLLGYIGKPGASKFLQFITDELAPRIDADYRTLPYRILTGWSDGGIFALHAMMQAPDAFRGYIVLAAALGDDQAMANNLRAFFEAHPAALLNADMYFGMDDVQRTGLARAYEAAAILQQRAGRVRDLGFSFHYYADQSHGAVPLQGTIDGLRSIFDGWELKDAFALYEQGGLHAIENHYAALAERLGFPVAVPADALFDAFNRLEGSKRYTEAEPVIARAVQLHPEDTTALYYQARLQNEMGNKAQAIETLRKALAIAPNDSGARSQLRELQVDPDTVVATVKLTAADLAKFAGSYGNPVVFEVSLRGDVLFAQSAGIEYKLDPLSATRFHYNDNNVYSNGGSLTFITGAKGRVTGVQFEAGPLLGKAP